MRLFKTFYVVWGADVHCFNFYILLSLVREKKTPRRQRSNSAVEMYIDMQAPSTDPITRKASSLSAVNAAIFAKKYMASVSEFSLRVILVFFLRAVCKTNTGYTPELDSYYSSGFCKSGKLLATPC